MRYSPAGKPDVPKPDVPKPDVHSVRACDAPNGWHRTLQQVLAPVLLAPGALLLINYAAESAGSSPPWTVAMLVLALLLLLFYWPRWVVANWPVQALADADQKRLDTEFTTAGLAPVRAWRWRAGQGGWNSVLVGLFPRGRQLLISEALLDTAPDDCFRALIRHELGHIHFAHVFRRLVAVALPLVLVAAGCLVGEWLGGHDYFDRARRSPTWWLMFGSGYLVYLALGFSQLARMYEYQADLFAAGLWPNVNGNGQSSYDRMQTTERGLRHLAGKYPAMRRFGGWLHPDLLARLHRVQRIQHDPDQQGRFRRQLLCTEWAVGLAGAGLAAVALLVPRYI